MHPDDDVARNLRNEQMRDAMPSPEEVEAESRRYLAGEGCKECGDDDPDRLDRYGIPMPSCSAVQVPPDPFVVLCDACADDRETLRERAFADARKRNGQAYYDEKVVGVIFYACEAWEYVTAEPFDEHGETVIYEDETPHWRASGPLRCRCGAGITEYVTLEDADGEADDAGDDAERDGYREGETVTFEWTDGSLKTGAIESFWTDHAADNPASATVRVPDPAYDGGRSYDIALAWIRASERDFDCERRDERVVTDGGDPDADGAGPAFAVGDAVVDTDRDDADDDGVCYVLDPDEGRADEVEVGETGEVVAAFPTNFGYPDDDPVVEVVFESALDHYVPGWDERPRDELDETLAEFAAEWGVTVQTYSYPQSRLRAVEADD